MKEERRTVTIRLKVGTYEKLRHAKHLLEKESFDEAVKALLKGLEKQIENRTTRGGTNK